MLIVFNNNRVIPNRPTERAETHGVREESLGVKLR